MRKLATAAGLCGALLLASGAAWAQVSEGDVRAQIEALYPVQVLKLEEAEVDGEAAYLLTVMNEGGDFNEAFQVNTLAVRQSDGTLISSFRHGASGYDVPPTLSGSPSSEIHPGQMRNGPWR